MNRYFLTTITIIAITAMAFTACTKKSETQTDFNIYSIWRYVSSADVEHGGTWVNDGEKSIAIFKDGEYAVVISGSYAWRGVLHDRGDYSYTFNAVIRLDYETGIVYNVEGQSPYTFVLKYDPQTRQLVSADGTVEEYYEWFSESGYVPDIDFSNTHQEIITADISAFAGTWVDVHGQKMQIKANGRLQLIDNNLHYFSDDYEADVYIFPAGVEFAHWSGTVRTDTARDRVFVQYASERVPINDDVYYREEEAPAENISELSDLSGQWRFESGNNINFFGQEYITISNNIHIEIWGVRPGESYLSGGAYTKETAVGEINRSGQLAVYHEGSVSGVFYFGIAVRGDVMSITDQDGNTAVFQKVYLQ